MNKYRYIWDTNNREEGVDYRVDKVHNKKIKEKLYGYLLGQFSDDYPVKISYNNGKSEAAVPIKEVMPLLVYIESIVKPKVTNTYSVPEPELQKILESHPNGDLDSYHDALNGITVFSQDGVTLIPISDVITALRCYFEERQIMSSEWD